MEQHLPGVYAHAHGVDLVLWRLLSGVFRLSEVAKVVPSVNWRSFPQPNCYLPQTISNLQRNNSHPKPDHVTYPLKEAARRQKESLQETVDEVEVR